MESASMQQQSNSFVQDLTQAQNALRPEELQGADSPAEIRRKNARDLGIALVALPIIAMAMTFLFTLLT